MVAGRRDHADEAAVVEGVVARADGVGLAKIRDRLKKLAADSGDKRHEPAALLDRLANEGGSFAAHAAAKAA